MTLRNIKSWQDALWIQKSKNCGCKRWCEWKDSQVVRILQVIVSAQCLWRQTSLMQGFLSFSSFYLALLLASFLSQWKHWVSHFQRARVILFGYHNLLCCFSKIAFKTRLHFQPHTYTHWCTQCKMTQVLLHYFSIYYYHLCGVCATLN